MIVTPAYTGDDGREIIDLILFENQGTGGTMVKGDGVYYCDMFGRGRDGEHIYSKLLKHHHETDTDKADIDYLWVGPSGEITLYENIQSPPNWGQHGVIININRDRRSIQFVSPPARPTAVAVIGNSLAMTTLT